MSEEYLARLVDEDALGEYLSEHLGPVEEYSVRRHKEGHSNETLMVTWGDRKLVLRRPPPGQTAETAHDVLREYRVTDALVATAVPVPPPVISCDDNDVIGSDFYLMERLTGDVIREEEPERFSREGARTRIGEELVDTLAKIHQVDVDEVGLSEFGHPEGYTERQVDRWGQQLMWAFELTATKREVSTLYEVGTWLTENTPSDHPHTLVHGDYKLDNVMFSPTDEPEIIGVFDWEMSTLGDPRSDLGWMLSYWRDPDDTEQPDDELTPHFMAHPDYPTRRELVHRYVKQTGIAFEHDRFYRALAVYKLAALGEMFYRRYLEGNSDDPTYPKMDERVPMLAERAKRIIEGEEPL